MRHAFVGLFIFASVGCAATLPITGEPAHVHVTRASTEPQLQHEQRTELSLPFAGSWVVMQGYHGSATHHGRAAYALDFVRVDAEGRAHDGRGARTKDWYGFGADVLATADGVVVRAIDHFPDNRVLGRDRDANTVIVKHAEAELSEYVHLQQGSLRVRVGEHVRRGQVLARCGNSGAQTPHLHWALLSSLEPIRTRPAVFSRYEAHGADRAFHPGAGTPREGEVVRAR